MTPQENLALRRADFHRVIDLILDHLSTGDAEELREVLKDPVFLLPSEEVSIETQHGAIDGVLDRAPSNEQATAMARRLMLEGFYLPMSYYVAALQEAAQTVDKELGEAYLEEAREITYCTRFFVKTISDHLVRKRQEQGGE